MSSRIVAETQERRPGGSLFKQQQLPACKPTLTPKVVVIGFLILGFVFLPLGVLFLTASNSVKTVEIDYTACTPSTNPNITVACVTPTVTLPAMQAPIYVYYQLTNYYQNHRRYVKSRNDAQLLGKPPSEWSKIEDCLPRRAVNEDRDKGSRARWFLPCGLIAWTSFNDTFNITAVGASTSIPWRKTGIAWETDKSAKFRNPAPSAVGTRLTPAPDFEDEDFIVWMRTSGLPSFRKLYRVIDQDVVAGQYTVQIASRFPVAAFGGTKSLVISTVSWMGGKNSFLGIAYIVVGLISIVIGLVLLIVSILCPRKDSIVE